MEKIIFMNVLKYITMSDLKNLLLLSKDSCNLILEILEEYPGLSCATINIWSEYSEPIIPNVLTKYVKRIDCVYFDTDHGYTFGIIDTIKKTAKHFQIWIHINSSQVLSITK